MEALLAEQRRTNRLLIAVLVTAIGFVIGLGLMQLAVRLH
jgi:ubiquinone biosynthesis protein